MPEFKFNQRYNAWDVGTIKMFDDAECQRLARFGEIVSPPEKNQNKPAKPKPNPVAEVEPDAVDKPEPALPADDDDQQEQPAAGESGGGESAPTRPIRRSRRRRTSDS